MTDERACETKSRCQQSYSQRHSERERLNAGPVKRAAIFGFVLRNEGAWESNPPARLVTPPTGFEDRAGHRARSTLIPSISDRHPDRQVSTGVHGAENHAPSLGSVAILPGDSNPLGRFATPTISLGLAKRL